MSEQNSMGAGSILVAAIVAFTVVLAAFYALDHLVFSMQGLPLNLDLTPAG